MTHYKELEFAADHKWLLSLFFSFAIMFAVGSSAASATADDAGNRPNIVVILADDMGFGDLACQNPETKIPTPNLDRLASQGMRFTDAHSPSAVCTPTRYSLLTGDYCWRTELQHHVLWSWDRPLIGADKLTMGGMLQEQGYSTACIGKWHLGWDWPTTDGSKINDVLPLGVNDQEIRDPFGTKVDFTKPIGGGPTARGFNYYFGDDVPNFPPYCFIENDRTIGIPTEEKPADMFGANGPMIEGWKLEDVMPAITKRSVEYIESHADNAPFFLYMPLTAPHTPIAPTEAFIGKSEAHRYGDWVVEVDWSVGQIMDALERTGQAENTLLVFTSDNGSPARSGENMAGPPTSVRKYGHNPSYIYRGIKADIWEGGHRVPFLVRWPDRVRAGAVNDEPICHVDLMATFAAVTGYDLPDTTAVDSYNILRAFEETPHAEPLRGAIVHHSVGGMFSIRRGPWKLIAGKGSGGWTKTDTSNDPPGQLYDMREDVREQHNRYDERPEIVAELEALLRQYKEEGRSVPHRN